MRYFAIVYCVISAEGNSVYCETLSEAREVARGEQAQAAELGTTVEIERHYIANLPRRKLVCALAQDGGFVAKREVVE